MIQFLINKTRPGNIAVCQNILFNKEPCQGNLCLILLYTGENMSCHIKTCPRNIAVRQNNIFSKEPCQGKTEKTLSYTGGNKMCYSRLPITRTLANLNLPLSRTNFSFLSGHFLYNFTLNNSNSR